MLPDVIVVIYERQNTEVPTVNLQSTSSFVSLQGGRNLSSCGLKSKREARLTCNETLRPKVHNKITLNFIHFSEKIHVETRQNVICQNHLIIGLINKIHFFYEQASIHDN